MTTKSAAGATASAKQTSRAWEALTPALSDWILDAISNMGFQRMTPVQASTIPLFMGNKDVVVEAVTGSGKTLAFVIPTIERLLRLDDPIKKHHIGAIIISPTRELATQIHSVLESLLRFHPPSAAFLDPPQDSTMSDGDSPIQAPPPIPSTAPRIVSQLLLGGTTTPAQDLSTFLTRSPNLLVATPGRLLELLSSPHVHCPQSSFEALIMDEADRLLDLGFSDTIQKILARLPKQRRTGLFSASVSEALDQLVRVGLRNPVRIAVKVKSASGAQDKKTPASLQMSYLTLPPSHKLPALRALLEQLQPTPQKTVVYVSTCAAVDYWQHVFPAILPSTFTTVPLHGKHPPAVRTKNFTKFVSSLSPAVLLTTDVAARGLDIPTVDLVVQLDPPSDPKTFLHRCGRAGRAGRRGLAVTMLQQGKEEDYVEFLRIRGTPISPLVSPAIDISPQDAEETTRTIRDVVRRDRAVHDEAQKAFVSFVRAYSKHAASSIFRVANLDWAELGRAWALLRLPRMPEAKTFQGDRTLGSGVELDSFRYNDPIREKRRLEEMEERKKRFSIPRPAVRDGEEGVVKGIGRDEKRKEKAWSVQKEGKATREERREKKHARREQGRLAKMSDAERVEEGKLRDMIELVKQRGVEEEWTGFD